MLSLVIILKYVTTFSPEDSGAVTDWQDRWTARRRDEVGAAWIIKDAWPSTSIIDFASISGTLVTHRRHHVKMPPFQPT
jgi:hypothetical protein